jgi:hypothetical protein
MSSLSLEYSNYGLIFNKRLGPRCRLLQLAYSPSFPTCLSHPRKCAPSLLNSPSTSPLPFWGFNNRLDRKSQSPVSNAQQTPEEQFPTNSHLERVLTGLTTHLFDSKQAFPSTGLSKNDNKLQQNMYSFIEEIHLNDPQ